MSHIVSSNTPPQRLARRLVLGAGRRGGRHGSHLRKNFTTFLNVRTRLSQPGAFAQSNPCHEFRLRDTTLSTYRSRYLVRLRERRSAPRRGHRWYFRKIKKRAETKHWVCGYHNRQCGYHNWACGYHNCQCGYHDCHPTEINDHSLFWNTAHNSTAL